MATNYEAEHRSALDKEAGEQCQAFLYLIGLEGRDNSFTFRGK